MALRGVASTKKREVIFGGRITGAKIRAEHARELAKAAQRDADRAEAELWSIRMEAYGGPAQPSPTISQCFNGGLGWLEVECSAKPTSINTTSATASEKKRVNAPIGTDIEAVRCRDQRLEASETAQGFAGKNRFARVAAERMLLAALSS